MRVLDRAYPLDGETGHREYSLSVTTSRWIIVSRTGTVIGRVVLPNDERLAAVLPGAVLDIGEHPKTGEPILMRSSVNRR